MFPVWCLWTDGGQVAILDATNSTQERRQFLVSSFADSVLLA